MNIIYCIMRPARNLESLAKYLRRSLGNAEIEKRESGHYFDGYYYKIMSAEIKIKVSTADSTDFADYEFEMSVDGLLIGKDEAQTKVVGILDKICSQIAIPETPYKGGAARIATVSENGELQWTLRPANNTNP